MKMKFERGRDIKEALNIGVMEKLPEWMPETEWNYKNYYDVWRWGIQEEKDFVFPLIVGMGGKKWFDETVIIGMEDNNGLLWISVSEMCLPAVKSILKIPNLFEDEVLNMRYGTSELDETFMRGDSKRHYRATNFGAFVALAMTQGHGNFEIKDALTNYYKKYKK